MTKPVILFESKDLLVAQKPAGLESQASRGYHMDMVSLLKNYRAEKGEPPYIGTVHRLDKPVEGILVYGKTKEATACLSAQLQRGSMIKDYLAVVCGRPAEKSGKMEDFLWKSPNRQALLVDKSHPQGKEARLSYRLLETIDFSGSELSLLEIRLETGRFHQIRAQLSHRGIPVFGDRRYGILHTRETEPGELSLVAFRLGFCPPGEQAVRYFSGRPQGRIFSFFSSYSSLFYGPDI